VNGNTGANNLSASSTVYTSLIATGSTPNTTSTNGNATVNCAATLGSVTVTLTTAPNSGGSTQSYTFTLMVNGVAGNSCTISEASTSCSITGVALAVGNTVNVRIVPSGTPTVTPVSSFSATYSAFTAIQ
jgi:hypothetical protein